MLEALAPLPLTLLLTNQLAPSELQVILGGLLIIVIANTTDILKQVEETLKRSQSLAQPQ